MTHKPKDWDDVPSILNSISWQLKCIAEELNTYNQSQQPAQHCAGPAESAEQPTPDRIDKLHRMIRGLGQ